MATPVSAASSASSHTEGRMLSTWRPLGDLARFPRFSCRLMKARYRARAPGPRHSPSRLTFIRYSIDFPFDGGTPIHHRFAGDITPSRTHILSGNKSQSILRCDCLHLTGPCARFGSLSKHHISTRSLGRFHRADMGPKPGSGGTLRYPEGAISYLTSLSGRGHSISSELFLPKTRGTRQKQMFIKLTGIFS